MVIITINYMFRPLYWPSSGLHYALAYKETIQYNLYGVVGGGNEISFYK
jgi:hypothetical protein